MIPIALEEPKRVTRVSNPRLSPKEEKKIVNEKKKKINQGTDQTVDFHLNLDPFHQCTYINIIPVYPLLKLQQPGVLCTELKDTHHFPLYFQVCMHVRDGP